MRNANYHLQAHEFPQSLKKSDRSKRIPGITRHNMANINESIEQLTASLQELMAETYNHAHCIEIPKGKIAPDELRFSDSVSAFLEETRAYSVKTRNVSVGSY